MLNTINHYLNLNINLFIYLFFSKRQNFHSFNKRQNLIGNHGYGSESICMEYFLFSSEISYPNSIHLVSLFIGTRNENEKSFFILISQ